MKLTKINLNNLKKSTTSGLEKDVLEYVIDNWSNYDDKTAIFTDVLDHGCVSGVVGHLIYYSDTVKYFDDHKDEINDLLHETLWSCGFKNPKDLFGDKWDDEDPLALDTYNKNLLAWFGFEETMRKVASKFEELESKI